MSPLRTRMQQEIRKTRSPTIRTLSPITFAFEPSTANSAPFLLVAAQTLDNAKRLPILPKHLPQVLDKQLRLLSGCEMPTALMSLTENQVRVRLDPPVWRAST